MGARDLVGTTCRHSVTKGDTPAPYFAACSDAFIVQIQACSSAACRPQSDRKQRWIVVGKGVAEMAMALGGMTFLGRSDASPVQTPHAKGGLELSTVPPLRKSI